MDDMLRGCSEVLMRVLGHYCKAWQKAVAVRHAVLKSFWFRLLRSKDDGFSLGLLLVSCLCYVQLAASRGRYFMLARTRGWKTSKYVLCLNRPQVKVEVPMFCVRSNYSYNNKKHSLYNILYIYRSFLDREITIPLYNR
jgi:hypothetical protein